MTSPVAINSRTLHLINITQAAEDGGTKNIYH